MSTHIGCFHHVYALRGAPRWKSVLRRRRRRGSVLLLLWRGIHVEFASCIHILVYIYTTGATHHVHIIISPVIPP